VFCEEHFVAAATPNPYTAPPPSPYASPYTAPVNPNAPSPGLAFILGLFIPGVGAIYNGQYAKGVIHVLVLGLLISIMGSGAANGLEPLIGLSTAVFVFYMAFEAYHTAVKRQRGEPVDEFSSILPMGRAGRGFPAGPLLLIGLGVIFLMETLNIVRLYQIVRFWPVFLILLGCYMLYVRMHGDDTLEVPPAGSEAGHER
jgi:TM2 domain-containing membrane protein YozV